MTTPSEIFICFPASYPFSPFLSPLLSNLLFFRLPILSCPPRDGNSSICPNLAGVVPAMLLAGSVGAFQFMGGIFPLYAVAVGNPSDAAGLVGINEHIETVGLSLQHKITPIGPQSRKAPFGPGLLLSCFGYRRGPSVPGRRHSGNPSCWHTSRIADCFSASAHWPPHKLFARGPLSCAVLFYQIGIIQPDAHLVAISSPMARPPLPYSRDMVMTSGRLA